MKNLRKNMPCPYQLALCTFMLIPSTLIYSGTASASASRHNDKTNPTLMEAVDSSKIKPSIVLDEVVVTGQGNAIQRRRLSEKVTKDRKSTRLNSSHANISYAVFCLKKK